LLLLAATGRDGETVFSVFFSVSQGITPFGILASFFIDFWTETQLMNNMTWIMSRQPIVLTEILGLKVNYRNSQDITVSWTCIPLIAKLLPGAI
jgi:hypothetical protein